MTTLPSDGSEDLQLLFAASKCLDLLLVLQTEEFQMQVVPSLQLDVLLIYALDINGSS